MGTDISIKASFRSILRSKDIRHFVRSASHAFSQMSIVVIPKFNFTDFLGSVVRYRITDLMYFASLSLLLPLYSYYYQQDCPTHARFDFQGKLIPHIHSQNTSNKAG